jgi:hypothetical protein
VNTIRLDRALHQPRQSGMAGVLETLLLRAQANAMAPIDLLSSVVYSLPAMIEHRVLLRHDLVRRGDRENPGTQRFEREWVRELAGELWHTDFEGRKENRESIGPLAVVHALSLYATPLTADRQHMRGTIELCSAGDLE